jgi:hypothetical protein
MAPSLKNVRIGTWVYILIFWIVASVFEGLSPPLQSYEYTFQRPITAPGTLQSQRWSFDFWVTVFYVSIWTVPLSLAFALDDTKGTPNGDNQPGFYFWRQIVHMFLVALLLLWYTGTFIYGVTLWAQANSSSQTNYHNPANDPRWCCVYYNLENHATNPGFPCTNTAPCTPGVGHADLITNPPFLFQLWFSFVFIIACLVDLMLVGCMMKPAYEAHALGSMKRSKQVV